MVTHGIKLAQKLKFSPRKVLVVQKRTRLVRETLRHPGYVENLETAGRHDDLIAIKRRHDVHESNLSIILTELRRHFDEVALVDTINREHVEWADVFISAGGDGTFLNVASQLEGGKWLIGLNTDPERSVGHLCARSRYKKTNLKYIIQQIAEGECVFIKRSRIRVKMSYDCKVGEVEIPKYALNDVYVGETSPTRLSYLELQIDKLPAEKQKSSGFLISTGSGSTAWSYHANALDSYRTEQFLKILRDSGLTNKTLNSTEITDVTNRFNESFIYPAEDRRMKYITREPLQNSVFRAANVQGYAKSITIRSLCWNGKIVMDGVQRKFNFDDGVLANFTTSDCDSLNSIQFVD